VLTNGCFDLLHIGHIRYLQQAKELGDALAVGINSDRSVIALKGRNRPLTPENERAEMLAALECVDYVTVFDEETAVALVEELRPAVYVKGGDYSSDPESPNFPEEARVAQANGGIVRIVDYVPERSTTDLLRRIRS
jgi:D-beta-D-heptose 7-phosphate kinase/D-beta-D-heptose 1-phosphate adenosyltransferase